ncbi:Monomeric sarcosine oxidase [Polystyrenella longa]|uniref:Monomeric sarcosine oxidase n=1 Tax=Polystyrenella longa TaxID=2528007 RepID=A0A518CMB4_9PLAN|nr:N-methyl-L-tryptophan oxidase [Polystyrenella longa]QDU80362.1 Monomeric sarcosine oxidase [Polystyrenella longa]
MPRPIFDCAVIGLGGVGSAAAYHLARRGVNVLGLEQFTPAHDLGSSHGETRIIRQAYFEHPNYVPLILRAYELFKELEETSGKQLLQQCGLLLAGPPEGETIQGARLAQHLHQIPLESVRAADWEDRFPGFRIPNGFDVVFEPVAGFLHVEETVRTHLDEAQKAGADLRFNIEVINWRKEGDQFVITTEFEEFIAHKLIVTAGAWTSELLNSLNVPLQVRRVVLCWNKVQSDCYNLSQGGSCFFMETALGEFYGFPSLDGQKLKLAEHGGGLDIANPDELIRTKLAGDGDRVAQFIESFMPQLKPQSERQAVCMYTLSPDHHFLVDEHPDITGIYLGAGFSGHGFKFTSVLGEILADLGSEGRTEHPIDFLRLSRFE